MAVLRRSGQFNPKRRIIGIDEASRLDGNDLAKRVSYGGNLEHKYQPGDYGLGTPPKPRPHKTMCDADGPFQKAHAVALLKTGAEKGMISPQRRNDWPQNIWVIADGSNIAYEAQLENPDQGVYHGYPMPADDPFRATVLKEWKKRT